MQKDKLIPVKAFCASHKIKFSFVKSIHQAGLIEITMKEKESFIYTDQLEQLEKIVRLYHELDINVEGIETITHLLQRINLLQQEIEFLKNKLRVFED